MKKIYRIFGSILTTLLTLHIILTIFMGIYIKFIFQCTTWGFDPKTGMPINWYAPRPWHQNLADSLGKFLGILIVITFIVSLVYFIVGCISYLFTSFGQKEQKGDGFRKIMVLRGALGMAIVFILYFIAQLIGAFDGFCL